MHILIVDDEDVVRFTLRSFLEHLGHRVSEAADAASALQVLQEISCDLILLGYRLPDLNGLELLSFIRQQDPDIRAVLITGMRDQAITDRALDLGVSGFLNKPIDLAMRRVLG
jgi:CheY-like chemotaxis protein